MKKAEAVLIKSYLMRPEITGIEKLGYWNGVIRGVTAGQNSLKTILFQFIKSSRLLHIMHF